jgi:hypothetical protein
MTMPLYIFLQSYAQPAQPLHNLCTGAKLAADGDTQLEQAFYY